MFKSVKELLHETEETLTKGDILVAKEIEIEGKKEEKIPTMTPEMLEEYLRAYIRRQCHYSIRPIRQSNPQGGYTRNVPSLDEHAQGIYDDIVLRQDYDDTRSRILGRAIKSVKSFSPAYVKRVLKAYQMKMMPS